ncbi:MAG: hypothetical protein PHQ89_00060 [Bacilli bacterium]|nr:hypothetical protein [Bacilli bacterium]
MEYFVKAKLIDGHAVFGIENERQEISLPYNYLYIREETCKFSSGKEVVYFVFYDKNGRKGVFINGQIIFCPIFNEIELLPIEEDNKFYFAIQNGTGLEKECGIISIYKYNRCVGNYQFKEEYAMGKGIEIKVVDGNVMLYKKIGKKVLEGVFNSKTMGDLEPIYSSLIYRVNYNICDPHMPDLIYNSYYNNPEWDFNNVKKARHILTYGKYMYNKERLGVYITSPKESLNNKISKWEEFIPCTHSKILFDEEERLVYLTEATTSKKSLMGYSEDWDISAKENIVSGSVTYSKEFLLPYEYDDLVALKIYGNQYLDRKESIRTKYIIVKKGNKYGLIKIKFQSSKSNFSGDRYFPAIIETMLECKYDSINHFKDYLSINSFVFEENGAQGLIVDTKDNNGKFLISKSIYNELNGISSSYVVGEDGLVITDNKKTGNQFTKK